MINLTYGDNMKISHRTLSIPPYISTSWRDVQSVHVKEGVLVISLLNGEIVQVPNLNEGTVSLIFKAHADFLDEEEKEEKKAEIEQRFVLKVGLEGVGQMLQHNQEQAEAQDLPSEMLDKIADMARMVIPDDPEHLPKAEPHCNCMYCQIARAIANEPKMVLEKAESEEVLPEELTFNQWKISQAGDQLFLVENRLDAQESYRVFLGDPIGCTCGSNNCDHLVAVLKS